MVAPWQSLLLKNFKLLDLIIAIIVLDKPRIKTLQNLSKLTNY